MTPGELSNLIGRISLGDRQAFRLLYSLTSAKLFGISLRILKDRAAAEDCLQEVYVKLWQNASKYAASDNSPMAWLAAVARNEAIDRRRRMKPQSIQIEDAVNLASAEPDPEAASVSLSEMARIENCLGTLKQDQAAAVRAAYLDGYSYQELASRYAIPLNTLRTWLRRSLLALRDCLQQ